MKIQIISDLHVEVNGLPDPAEYACDADVMIVAGDVGPAPSVIPVIQHISQHISGEVFYVAGNHEAYGLDKTLGEVLDFLEEEAAKTWEGPGPKIRMLKVDTPYSLEGGYLRRTEEGDYRTEAAFFGDTLWTDFRLFDSFRDRREQYYAQVARSGINDYKRIKDLTPEETSNRSKGAYSKLRALQMGLRADKKIGVSHHLPTAASLDKKYQGSNLNPAFASRYDVLLEEVNLWVHGHTHTSCNYVHNPSGCRVVCNPKGYGDENPKFNPRLVVEI